MSRMPDPLKGRHLLRVADREPDELRRVLDLAGELKTDVRSGPPLARR
jgi:ornithine carbamoyltransferase